MLCIWGGTTTSEWNGSSRIKGRAHLAALSASDRTCSQDERLQGSKLCWQRQDHKILGKAEGVYTRNVKYVLLDLFILYDLSTAPRIHGGLIQTQMHGEEKNQPHTQGYKTLKMKTLEKPNAKCASSVIYQQLEIGSMDNFLKKSNQE